MFARYFLPCYSEGPGQVHGRERPGPSENQARYFYATLSIKKKNKNIVTHLKTGVILQPYLPTTATFYCPKGGSRGEV